MPLPDLARVYDEHAASVFAFARTLTRSDGEAREILQEVFVKLAEQKKPDAIRDLRPYLLRIAQCAVIDRARRDGARRRSTAKLAEEDPSWFAPAMDADTECFREALTAALSELPQDQRAVIHLKLWEGRTFEEIAALLEISLNTAASRYRYALAKLRTALLPLYEEIRHLPLP